MSTVQSCYTQSIHGVIGFSAGLEFETKIMVKEIPRSCSGTVMPEVEAAEVSDERYDRLISNYERKLAHTRLPSGFGRIPQPGQHRHEDFLVTRDLDC